MDNYKTDKSQAQLDDVLKERDSYKEKYEKALEEIKHLQTQLDEALGNAELGNQQDLGRNQNISPKISNQIIQWSFILLASIVLSFEVYEHLTAKNPISFYTEGFVLLICGFIIYFASIICAAALCKFIEMYISRLIAIYFFFQLTYTVYCELASILTVYTGICLDRLSLVDWWFGPTNLVDGGPAESFSNWIKCTFIGFLVSFISLIYGSILFLLLTAKGINKTLALILTSLPTYLLFCWFSGYVNWLTQYPVGRQTIGDWQELIIMTNSQE